MRQLVGLAVFGQPIAPPFQGFGFQSSIADPRSAWLTRSGRDASLSIEVGVTSRRVIDALSRRRVYRDVFEFALVAFAFLLYFIVRGSVVDRDGAALSNAVRVIDFERKLGFYWEPRLNDAVLSNHALVQFFDAVYFWLDFPFIVAVGIWLYLFHRHEYTVARDSLLASGAIALVVYNLFPVMPPRLLAEHGYSFVDTLDKYTHIAYQADSMQAFVNPYAAMPSLHYGWAVLVGGALFWTARSWWLRAVGVLLPAGQFTAILFTANHFITDAMAGLIVGLMGLLIAMALQRWGYAALHKRFGRL
jgi:hypothetical protein